LRTGDIGGAEATNGAARRVPGHGADAGARDASFDRMEKVDAPPAAGHENAARIEDVLTAVIDDHVTASLTDVEALIARGPAMLHVDGRRDDVTVPARFAGEPRLVLRFGHGLTPPIADLTVDEGGVAATLTFGGVPFHVVLPWAAVYAAGLDGEPYGTVWPDDVPDVVREAARSDGEEAPPTEAAAPVIRQRGHLTLID
jgi:hypothetical protein